MDGMVSLYLEGSPVRFAGSSSRIEDSEYVLYGVPFDSTSSYKPGSRFAPLYLREASLNIESNSLTGHSIFIEEVEIADLGDLAVVHGDPVATLERISAVAGELGRSGKVAIAVGGEHTITAGIAKGLASSGIRPCLLVFDAHLDLRDEYLGCRHGHASAIRRALESLGDTRLVYVGARAYAREEIDYARALGDRIRILGPGEVRRLGPSAAASVVREALRGCRHIYLSFDIDGIDPAFAPGTGTPEPMGLDVYDVFRILSMVVDERFIGMDIVEVNPLVDHAGITSILAARIVQEFVLIREGKKRSAQIA